MITKIREELNLFYLALSFFSRLPVPKSMVYSPVLLNQSGRYFSAVGLVLALILVVVYTIIYPYFNHAINILLIVICSLLLTGAFHEDGLADMADGIGGGMTVEKRLLIMKDSRIGTYGAVALFMALALKISLLITLANMNFIVPALIISYPLSRAVTASLIFDMDYVADVDTSKSKPLASKQTLKELTLLLSIGLVPLLLLLPILSSMAVLGVLLVFRQGFKSWLIARLGGYTGDCLGACQQVNELLIYLLLIAVANSSTSVVADMVTPL